MMPGPYPNDQGNPAGAIPVYSAPYHATPLGFQQITSLAASTGLVVPAGATFATIVPAAQAVSWRDDGVAPTATVGMLLPVGTQLQYSGNLAAIRFIEAAASATLNISYYK
jgi:hypothetical protein